MYKYSKYCIVTLLVYLSACADDKPNINVSREAILDMHSRQRDFHFAKDSISFLDQLSYDFVSVNNGKISYPSRDSMLSKYHAYFSAVNFLKWDDQNEPIIRISEDGTMAYVVVDKMVEVEYMADSAIGSTHFAWTAIYQKRNGEWKITCVTSTNQ